MFAILESKENEIKELQKKLETITKEQESCQKEAESSEDQLKIVKIEPNKIVQESEVSEKPEKKKDKKDKKKRIGKRFRSTVKKFNYQLKSSVQVNLIICF